MTDDEYDILKLVNRMTLRLLEAHADIAALKVLLVDGGNSTIEELNRLCRKSRILFGCPALAPEDPETDWEKLLRDYEGSVQ